MYVQTMARRVGHRPWPILEEVVEVAGERRRVSAPAWYPLRLRILWQIAIRHFIQWELEHPDLGWKLLTLTDPEVAFHPASGSALFQIVTYPGFLGTLAQTKNPFIAALRVLHEDSLNARAVLNRSVIACQWMTSLVRNHTVNYVADLGAGSALTFWQTQKITGRPLKLLAVDQDPWVLVNLRQAAAYTGQTHVPIHPALVLDQEVLGQAMTRRVKAILPKIAKRALRLGMVSSGEPLVSEGPVALGDESRLSQAIAGLDGRGGVVPVLGDARFITQYSGQLAVDVVTMLGVLDYYTESEVVDYLRRILGLVRPGGWLVLAHMRPNVEFPWVEAVPWRLAVAAGAILKPKDTATFVRLVQQAGIVVQEISLTAEAGVYTLILGQRPA